MFIGVNGCRWVYMGVWGVNGLKWVNRGRHGVQMGVQGCMGIMAFYLWAQITREGFSHSTRGETPQNLQRSCFIMMKLSFGCQCINKKVFFCDDIVKCISQSGPKS